MENLNYDLPNLNGAPARVIMLCQEAEEVEFFLDNLEQFVEMYATVGMTPPGCAINAVDGFYLPEDHSIRHLYLADSGILYGIIGIDVETEEFGTVTAWTYIEESVMVNTDKDKQVGEGV